MRQGARLGTGQARGVSERARQAVRIFRRPGDEGDGRQGQPEGYQRNPEEEARRLTLHRLRTQRLFFCHSETSAAKLKNLGSASRSNFTSESAWCRTSALVALEPARARAEVAL